MQDRTFDDTMKLAGWLLAHQVYTAASGDSPMPVVCFNHGSLDSPRMIAPRLDEPSESYNDHVLAGRVLIEDQGNQFSSWAFAYDEDLEPSGRAFLVEVGGKEFGDVITFAQRYTFDNDHGLRFLGDLELVGEEFLPSKGRERLESRHWRFLIPEGAAKHDLAGPSWKAWDAARDHSQAQLRLEEFSFVIPEGWNFRQTKHGNGWLMVRLLPWEHKGFEPTITTLLLTYPCQVTLEDVVERTKAEVLGEGREVLEGEISQVLPPVPLLKVGRLIWSGEAEGRSFRAERIWVPTDVPGRFLGLWAVSLSVESWESVVRALDAVLTSLEVSKRGNAESRRTDEDSKSWLTKLWQKWRP